MHHLPQLVACTFNDSSGHNEAKLTTKSIFSVRDLLTVSVNWRAEVLDMKPGGVAAPGPGAEGQLRPRFWALRAPAVPHSFGDTCSPVSLGHLWAGGNVQL